MRRASVVLLAILASTYTFAQKIPSPESVIGFKVGADYKLADWATIRKYFDLLDKASPRVTVRTIGVTPMGREMIVAEITSEKNMRDMARLRGYLSKLHDPRKIGGQPEEREILANAKPAVLINCSIHASEVAASQMSMDLAYELASSNDKQTIEILDNTIVEIIVGANPDGLDLVRDWYYKTKDSAFEEAPMPWVYNKYVGHDNNRDWWLVSQRETQIVSDYLYKSGFPTLLYDVHQMGGSGARFFVPPFFDPTNPNIDPIVSQSIFMLGGHMATDLASAGKQGVLWRAIYDNWWQGGMRTTPQRHNVVAILTEAASARGASPVVVRPEDLRGHDRGLPTYDRYVNFPDPWPGGTWRLRDIVDYELIASRSLLRLAARYRDMWIRNQLEMSRKQVLLGRTQAPYGWVWEAGKPGSAQLAESLIRSGIEVSLAEESLTVNGKQFAAGSWVVLADQPYRAHVKDLMEVQVYPDRRVYPGGPAERPYDVAGWTAPLMMGVAWESAQSPVKAKLRPVRLSDVPPVAGQDIQAGSRVGLYQPWTANMDEGWTRFVFERYGVKFTTLRNADIRAGSLRAKFDCVFLPSQSPASILGGVSRTFPEYAGGIGEDGLAELKKFAEEGGTLVLMDDASMLGARLGLPVKDAVSGIGREKFFCPGSILRTKVDMSQPLARGLPGESIAYFADARAFEIGPVADGSAKIVARYGEGNPLLSGYLLGPEYIAGKPAVVEFSIGKGRVILFGFGVQYRGQSIATFPYMWNAMRMSVGK